MGVISNNFRKNYTGYNETPTKGTIMNKNKIDAIKSKIKKYPYLIITTTTVLTTTVVVAILIKKFLDENSTWHEGFELTEVTGQDREDLMKNDEFALLKITIDEYTFARRTTED